MGPLGVRPQRRDSPTATNNLPVRNSQRAACYLARFLSLTPKRLRLVGGGVYVRFIGETGPCRGGDNEARIGRPRFRSGADLPTGLPRPSPAGFCMDAASVEIVCNCAPGCST
jgi:hypothetical protein